MCGDVPFLYETYSVMSLPIGLYQVAISSFYRLPTVQFILHWGDTRDATILHQLTCGCYVSEDSLFHTMNMVYTLMRLLVIGTLNPPATPSSHHFDMTVIISLNIINFPLTAKKTYI